MVSILYNRGPMENPIVETLSYIVDKVLKYNFDTPGFVNGNSSKLLFLSSYYKNFGSNEILHEISDVRTSLIDLINCNEVSNLTLSYGLCGMLFSLKQSYDQLNEENEVEIDTDFAAYLLNESVNMIADDNFDLLTGGIGIVNFLVDNYPQLFVKDDFNCLIEALVSKQYNHVWLSEKDRPSKNINLGLSHGYIGIVFVLLKIYKLFPSISLDAIITNSLDQTLLYKNVENGISIFPNAVNESYQNKNHFSRLAWCYGDLGLMLLFLSAGNILSRKSYFDEGLKLFKNTVHRKDLNENLIFDSSFCHGSAGIAHILNVVKHKYNIQDVDDAYYYWINITLEMMKSNSLYSYEPESDQLYVENFGLLNGYCGVGMVLLDCLAQNKNLHWSNSLLV